MSEIRLSRYRHALDGVPKPLVTTWEAFVAMVGPHQFLDAQRKKELPAFSPAEIRPGMPRLARNVIRVWFGVLDLDHIPADRLARIVQRCEGLDAVAYTSWSHPERVKAGKGWSVRICVRLSRPIEQLEWPPFWRSMLRYFDAPADEQCKDPCRIYFGAFSPLGTDPALCHYVVFKGQPLDVAKLDTSAASVIPSLGTEKIARDRLQNVARTWKRSRDEYRGYMGDVLLKVVNGEPFAEPGNRDNTLFQLCKDVIKAFPTGSAQSLAAHFGQSLQLMGVDAPSVEDVQAKLERAQEETATEAVATEIAEVSEAKLRIRESFAHLNPERDWPYTQEELDAIADKSRCSRDELKKRWIIQRGTLFYLLGPGGVYSDPYTEKDFLSAVLRDLSPARSAGVELWNITEQGTPVRKLPIQLMGEYGSVATTHVLDMRAQEARYDNITRTFFEAPCPVRKLTPTFDPEVQAWLHLLFGDQEADALNWIALVTDLDNTCAALMITGRKGTGKGLLAQGLARIWTTTQATSIDQAFGGFNEALAHCPLIFADEQIPKDFRGQGRTSELRQLIGDRSRPYTKKYAPDSSLLGAIRLIIAANNKDVLSFHENLSKDDIEAVADRIFHVNIPADRALEAEAYLASHNAPSFVHQDRLAKHALWLRDHFPVTREGRFMIRSRTLQTIMALTTKGGVRSALCQWLVGYLKAPSRIDALGDLKVRIKGGRLYVNTEGVLNHWDVYVGNEATPTAGRLAQAVSALADQERVHLTRPKAAALHYRAIITGHLYAWADQTEFASREEIDRALAVDTEARLLFQAPVQNGAMMPS